MAEHPITLKCYFQNLLLRRPISQANNNSEASTHSSLNVNMDWRRSNSLPVVTQEYFEPNQSVSSDIEENTPKFSNEKKTVKVDIDIPLCDTTRPNKEADCEDNFLNDKRDSVEEDNVELCSCDNDDVQSVQSVKSNDSLRYKLVLTLIVSLH